MDKLIREQDLAIAIQQRYVAAKYSIELVLEASKPEKVIPESIEKLSIHEKLMSNYLEMFKRAPFSSKGSSEDKHLKAWVDNMSKAGAERSFPNMTTAGNVLEATRILMRSRQQLMTKLTLSMLWDQVRGRS